MLPLPPYLPCLPLPPPTHWKFFYKEKKGKKVEVKARCLLTAKMLNVRGKEQRPTED